ncbi:MAG: ATP-binding protein [Ignavibacteria bacterium]|nr:ATP-binding protein [Ignavibacteria bacterium]
MKKYLSNLLKKENRSLLLIIIGFILLFLSAITFPIYQRYIETNWENYLKSKIDSNAEKTQAYFNNRQKKLSSESDFLVNQITSYSENRNIEKKQIESELFKILLQTKKNFSYQLLDGNQEVIAWSDYKIPSSYFQPFEKENEFRIIKTNFKTYLTFQREIKLKDSTFFLITFDEIESNYFIKNEFIENISFSDFLSRKFDLKLSIIWDTLYFSINPDLLTKNSLYVKPIKFLNDKTAFYISIEKPEVELYLSELRSNFGYIQKIIFLLILITLIYSLFRDIRTIESRILQVVAFTFLIWLFRIVLLLLNFPEFLISGNVVNPSIYASRFLFGLVKSPLELFLTSTTLAINLILIFVLYRTYLVEKKQDYYQLGKSKLFYVGINIFLIVITPFVLRGFGASFRSFVFDSTIKFFEQPSLIPDIAYLVMYYSVFVTGISLVLYLIFIIYLIDRTFNYLFKKNYHKLTFILSVLILPVFLFYLIDKSPQFELFTIICLIVTVVLITLSSLKENSILTFRTIFLILITASFFSSIFIFDKNIKQEKGFQKTIAYELLKPREQLINFAINQTLQQIATDDEFARYFFIESSSGFSSSDLNFLAYRLWINSILSEEGLNSYLFIFDKYGKPNGSFGFGMKEPEYIKEYFDPRLVQNLTIFLVRSHSPNDLFGVIPIRFKNSIIGYCGIVIELSQSNFQPTSNNTLFKNIKYEKNPFVLVPDAVVYITRENQLELIKGNDLPEIREVNYELFNQAIKNNEYEIWHEEIIGNKKFRTFYFIYDDSSPIGVIAVSVPEKSFILTIFNLFKVSLVHIIIAAIILLIGTILLFAKGYKFKLKFKTKLFIGLFVVTLIPIILLAYFTRESELHRWKENLSKELKKDLDITSLFLNENLSPEKNNFVEIQKVSQQLGIDFNIYKNSDLIFSTQKKLYDIGFFPSSIPAKVFKNLILEHTNYTFDFEYISDFPYLVGYKKINVNDFSYIISIPTLYRQEKIKSELAQIDTFIFGAYSLTLLLIFLFGNLFFERLTKPISELTEATKKVSSGDLSIKLEPKETGEVGDLIEAFNKMITDLDESRKNLARAEREQAWKEMAKQVAHEIKNPLTPMKLSLQHLQFLYKENRKEFAKIFGKVSTTLIEQIEALTKITNEFSHFARMPERNLIKCNLEEILKEVIALFSTQIEIKFEYLKNENFFVNADKEELKRVFINIIKNSIQANSTKIKLKLYKDANYCFINVEDNGSGIPEDLLDKIFDPNFSTKTEGSGLGLPIVKRILNDINGTIEIKSEVGKGTIVMIAIPQIKE